jgi:hypothetical protein
VKIDLSPPITFQFGGFSLARLVSNNWVVEVDGSTSPEA